MVGIPIHPVQGLIDYDLFKDPITVCRILMWQRGLNERVSSQEGNQECILYKYHPPNLTHSMVTPIYFVDIASTPCQLVSGHILCPGVQHLPIYLMTYNANKVRILTAAW